MIDLKPENFKRTEWLALNFVRGYIVNGCSFPDGEFIDEYKKTFPVKQVRYHMKLARMMYFANHWKNTWNGRPWNKDIEVCSSGSSSKALFSFDSVSDDYLKKGDDSK